MITLTGINGTRHYVAAGAIAKITEAGPSSQWHGIRSIVKLFDGSTLECCEEAKAISAEVARHDG